MLRTPNVIGVIPARMSATRLPGKPLHLIAGIPMIQRVYQGASSCRGLRQLVVATDGQEIAAFCRSQDIPVHMTLPTHPSGTDRVWQVVNELQADAALNIQGDEPLVCAAMLESLLDALFSSPAVEVASLYTPVDAAEASQPSACKVVVEAAGRALYFSRAPIPYPRDGAPAYKKHLGFYAYSRAALNAFHSWPPSELEQHERLEQLRFLDHGVPIAMAETPFNTIGVDTAEDLAAVVARLNAPDGQHRV